MLNCVNEWKNGGNNGTVVVQKRKCSCLIYSVIAKLKIDIQSLGQIGSTPHETKLFLQNCYKTHLRNYDI